MKLRGLALGLLAAFAFATPIAAVDLGADTATIAAEKARWVERLREKHDDLAQAKARHTHAQATYQRMKTRNKMRGDRRTRIVSELRASETALADAEAGLEAALSAARREGVPPGWIREASSGGNAAPAPND